MFNCTYFDETSIKGRITEEIALEILHDEFMRQDGEKYELLQWLTQTKTGNGRSRTFSKLFGV